MIPVRGCVEAHSRTDYTSLLPLFADLPRAGDGALVVARRFGSSVSRGVPLSSEALDFGYRGTVRRVMAITSSPPKTVSPTAMPTNLNPRCPTSVSSACSVEVREVASKT